MKKFILNLFFKDIINYYKQELKNKEELNKELYKALAKKTRECAILKGNIHNYIAYTTEGVTYAPNETFELENCQMLGEVIANSLEEAKKNLIDENPWIPISGFDPDKIVFRKIL